MKTQTKKKRIKWSTFILLLIFFIGLSVMLYPAISNFWNSKTQSESIVDYDKMIQSLPKEDYKKFFDAAHKYNDDLASLNFPLLEYSGLEGYNDILNISGTGMMGYITIEKINLELPVYHTTDNDVLSIAVGHLEGSSFPIGGEGTHAVVSAHRGLPTATLFTNLDHLEIGDTFSFTILDKTVTYQVDQIKTVDPSDTRDLIIEGDKELCTLLTCTPYGINTHRLLVRGVKVSDGQIKNLHITSDAYRIEPLIVTPIVALPMIFTLMMIVLFKPVKKDSLGDDIE